MKRIFVLLAAMLVLTSIQAKDQLREKRSFDFGWKFQLGDDPSFQKDSIHNVAFAANSFNDAAWQDVQIPHDWNVTMEFDSKAGGGPGYIPESKGWYRKTFSVNAAELKQKQFYIHFEGVFHQSEVYINGHHLGFHPYGFTSFEYDLTPYLKAGSDNVLAVRVNCTGGRPRWYAGAGIYRHTWLKVVNPVHINTYGIGITTPEVSDQIAQVRATTSVNQRVNIKIRQTIYSPDGKKVAQTGWECDTIATLQVVNPQRWDVNSPRLYRMVTEVKTGSKLVDVQTTKFGIRTINFDANKGFSLNGRHMKLQGVCLHQDDGVLGTAITRRSMERRLLALKEYGCNAIRCSHNQPAAEFLDLCDSIGFVVIDEAFDKWKSGYYGKYFDQWWQCDMTDMIMRDRNHPSIILWSIGNELSEAWKGGTVGVERATMLRDFVHQLEPTRLTVLAAQNNHKDAFSGVTDCIGYNYLEARMLSDHKKYPERRFLITEELPYYQGAEGNLRSYDTDNPWNVIAKNDFCAGGFIWPGVDYLGEAGWPGKGWPGGLFDICMQEKPRAAYHRAMWNKQPMVSISVEHQGLDIHNGRDLWQWPRRASIWDFPLQTEKVEGGYEGLVMQVYTTTNCEEVELSINGKVMGRKRTADFPNHAIEWNVPYRKGSIVAKAFNGDSLMATHELHSTGKTQRLVLTPDRPVIAADGHDLSYITVELQDNDGRRALNDDRQLTVSFEGEGTLMGIETGDLRRDHSWSTTSVKSYFGRAMVIVRSTRNPGTMKVKLRMEGSDTEYTALITTK